MPLTAEELRQQFEGRYSVDGMQPTAPQVPTATGQVTSQQPPTDPALDSLRTEFEGRYSVDQPISEERDYDTGIGYAFMRGIERLSSLPDVAQGDYEELAQHNKDMERWQMSDEDAAKLEEIRNTEGFWNKAGQLMMNPRLVLQTVAESFPMMAAPITGAIGGGLAGGAMAGPAAPAGAVVGGMAGGALGSYFTEYYASIGEYFGEQGVDMTNAAQLKAAFQDQQIMNGARDHAMKRGIPIAIFDGLSMGLAGRIAKPISNMAKTVTGGRRVGAGVASELTMQAGFGMAGEAGAQLSSEGAITDELDVLMEGFAELAPGVVEAGVSNYVDRKAQARKAGVEDPNTSPLAALDQPAPEDETSGWSPIAATDIDPQTGKVVTRTGDIEQDQLDVALEDGLAGLQMELEAEAMGIDVAEGGALAEAARAVSPATQTLEMEAERTEALAKEADREDARKRQQIQDMYDQRLEDQMAAEVGPVESEMVTPEGLPVEGEPIDVAGGQPIDEGMILDEGIVPTGGRPLTTSLGEALRGAGVVPPPPEPPAGGGVPTRGPDVTPAEQRAADALADEAEGLEERAAIQDEAGPITVEPDDQYADIPYEPLAVTPTAPPKKPAVPKPTRAVNYARDNFLTTRAKETTDKRLSMAKFEAEGLDIEDMREPKYGGKPAFSRNPAAWGPDDVAEFLNEQGYPNPFDNGSVGTWDANMALEAIRDELGGSSEILTAEAIGNRAAEAGYERDVAEFEQPTAAPEPEAPAFELETQPAITPEAPPAAPAPREEVSPDIGVPGDLFSPGANAQVDLVDESRKAAKEERGIPEGLKLRDMKPSELTELAEETEMLITKFEKEGEKTGYDRNNILLSINKLKLHGDPRADQLMEMFEDRQPGRPLEKPVGLARDEQGLQERYYYAEQLHEKWRKAIDKRDPDPAEVAEVEQVIEDMIAANDEDAFQLAIDQDWWTNWGENATTREQQGEGRKPIQMRIKTNHERFKKARKSNKWGNVAGLTHVSAQGVSVEVSQLSWTVPYDTLTFESPKDKARLDRIIDVYNRTHDKPVKGTKGKQKVTQDDAGGMRTSNAYFMGFNDVLDRASKGEEFQAAGSPSHTIEIETAPDGTLEVNLYKQEGVQAVLVESGEIALYDTLATKFTELSAAASDNYVSVYDLPKIGPPVMPIMTPDGEYVATKGEVFPKPGRNRRVLEEAKFDRESLKDESDPTAWSIPKVNRKIDFDTNDNATDVFERMKADAEEIGNTENNQSKVILSLFDATGTWSQPWADAGYTVIRYDSARGDDINSIDWMQQKEALAEKGYTVYGVLAAPPCTSFSNAGARWWGQQHDVADKAWVEKKYGKQAAFFYDRPLDYAEALVNDVNIVVDLMDPEVYAMENPSGRIRSVTDLPLATLSFDPWHFGDPYTKRTHLWGEFNADLEIMPVVPTEGSKMHKMHSGAEKIGGERSATPDGFAYSFFHANHKPPGTEAPAAPVPTEAPVPSEADIDAAANVADPDAASDAQKKAGNYKKGHMAIAGLDFTIENPAGTIRHGKLKLKDHYGYIKRTVGNDGDQVDVFINSKAQEDFTGDVYIVDQIFPEIGGFDEHKVMFGYNNLIDARRAYRRNFNKDWKGAGPVTKMTLDEFKTWLAEPGANKTPASLSPVTEAGRKERAKSQKDLRYASGKDILNAPNNEWVETVLSGGAKKMGDMPDTVPLNVAVTELLKIQEQREGAPAAPAKPSFETIAAAIKPVEDSLPGAPVTLLHNYKQAPKAVAKGMQDQGMTQVKAVFDPQTGEIFIFADQIESIDEATRTSLHEKAHRGLRVAFGNRLDPLLDDVFKTANNKRQANMNTIAEKYRLDPNNKADQRIIAEELLAHMAEHDVTDGMVNRAVAFIRKILRDMGVTIEFTDNDIRALIREAQGAVSRQQVRTEGVVIEEEVTVEGSEEIYVVEQDADVVLTGVNNRIEICKKLRACL